MKLFIWDFHGTLEKGTERAAYEITNRVLEEYGYPQRMDEALVDRLYGKKWHEYFAYLLPHESKETHMSLQERCFAVDLERPEIIKREIKPNDYARHVLAEIGSRHEQILISNTSPERLRDFLEMTELSAFFPEERYFGRDAHQASATRSKKDVAEEYITPKEFERIVVIGDSPQDMIPLKNAVTYLYAHVGKPFGDCDATYKIRDLREVLREM
ncbi:MAG: HAD family hydrolase [Candidatus Sungbacteria bacterium]|nr:HAD family hydrolase [Candidatus Sungbacteria bacterium]